MTRPRNEEPCDYCVAINKPDECPGQKIHCSNGEHCTTTSEACALDARHFDHPHQCEDCGKPLKRGVPA